mgnify:CR=1 FL=1
MDQNIWYNNQHISIEDLEQIYIDCEQLMADHIYDYHYSDNQFVLASPRYGMNSLRVLAQTYPSLTVQISGGVAYQDQKRIEISTAETYTLTNPPSILGGGFNITRIDLIYLLLDEEELYPFSKDFIDANRNIYQETVYTRKCTSYTINKVTGVYNIGGGSKPSIPSNGIALAYIHLRDGTNKIYNTDTGSLNEGFIEDARNLVTP